MAFNSPERDVALRRLNPIEAVGYGVAVHRRRPGGTLNVMRRLVTGKDGPDKLSGPVGIFTLTDNVTDMHMKQQGVALGESCGASRQSNPACGAPFDRGRFLQPVADSHAGRWRRRNVRRGSRNRAGYAEKVQRVGQTIGLACLGLFALAVTWQDIARP